MSKIVKILSNSVLGRNNNCILCHKNDKIDNKIIEDLDYTFYVLEKHNNEKVYQITEQDLIDPIFIPDFVICTSLIHYQQAKNISVSLYLPLINILHEDIPVKKENSFMISKEIDKDINLVLNKKTLEFLYITNHIFLSDIKDIKQTIEDQLKLWKPL